MLLNIKEFEKYADCNKCKHLNMTEREQQQESKDTHSFHKCNVYNSQVMHFTNKKHHNPRLYPCQECREDFYKKFEDR